MVYCFSSYIIHKHQFFTAYHCGPIAVSPKTKSLKDENACTQVSYSYRFIISFFRMLMYQKLQIQRQTVSMPEEIAAKNQVCIFALVNELGFTFNSLLQYVCQLLFMPVHACFIYLPSQETTSTTTETVCPQMENIISKIENELLDVARRERKSIQKEGILPGLSSLNF